MSPLSPTCRLPAPAGPSRFLAAVAAGLLPLLVAAWGRWQPMRPRPARGLGPGDPGAWRALADHPPYLLRDIGLAPTDLALLERQATLRALRWQAHMG